jgi:hypothetical protein
MEYKKGEFYFLSRGFCRIYDPNNTYIQDKFIPKSIHESFCLNDYICPDFIIVSKVNESLLIYYNNKFGLLNNHTKIKLKNSNE